MKKINYRLRIFICFCLIVILMIFLLSIPLYLNVKKTMKEETINTSHNTIMQLKKATELTLKEADRLLLQVALDSSLEYFSFRYDSLNYRQIDDTMEILQNTISSNIYFTSCYIYYFNDNKVIDVNVHTPRLTDLNKLKNKEIINRVWDIYQSKTDNNMFTFYRIKIENQSDIFTLVKPINIVSKEPKALIIVTLSPEYFDYLLNNIKIIQEANVYIIDKNGEIISKKHKSLPIFQENKVIDNENKLKVQGNFETEMNGENYLVSYTTSEFLGWKFIYTIPTENIYNKIDFVKHYILLLVIFCFVLGVIVSLFFTRNLYKPIYNIAMNFKKNNNNRNKINDDITYIDYEVKNLITNNNELEKSLEDSMPTLRNSLVRSILKNNFISVENIWTKINFYKINIEKGCFYCVSVSSIDKYQDVIKEYSEKQIGMLEVYQRKMILNVCKSYKDVKAEIEFVDTNKLVIIFSIDCMNRKKVIVQIKNLILLIHKKLTSNLNLKLSVGVGSVYSDICKTYISYNEALTSLGYKVIKGNNKVIFIDEIPQYEDWHYIYPYSIEKNIFINLKQGEGEKVLKFQKDYFDYIKSKINNSRDIQYACIHLLDNTIKCIVEMSLNIDEILISQSNLYKELINKETVDDIYIWFNDLYDKIIKFIYDKKNNQMDEMVLRIVDYIDNNYNDINISLNLISDKFNYSNSYLSKLFKEIKGISIKQYITDIRINEAKKLLEQTNLKIKEVAYKVGYLNDRSFINIFKKYEGETPGEYRNIRKITIKN